MRYWLSVGATPTPGAHRMLEKYGMVPKAPRPFGNFHAYTKPERTPIKQKFFSFKNGTQIISGNKIAFTYRAKLQEEMNIIERKRRLTAESLNRSGTNLDAASAATELDDEDTDGMESDEADIFERKRKFEKLLERFERHKEENRINLKGNDLRYNVYLRKMEKYARKDMGLDIAGYKDYVNNLKEFASVNGDMQIFAIDNFRGEREVPDENTVYF